MSDYSFSPFDGLLSIKKSQISNVDVLSVTSFVEKEVPSFPKGRTSKLALLFYFIKLLKENDLELLVKGGILLQYFLKDHSRATNDIDLITPIDSDTFKAKLERALENQHESVTFKINYYFNRKPNATYFYDCFYYYIGVYNASEMIYQFILDGVSSKELYSKIKPVSYKAPEYILPSFDGVPIEFTFAEKIIAITNELDRPYKHLIDVYSLMHIDFDKNLLKKYLRLITDSDNKVRREYSKKELGYTYQITDEHNFRDSYVIPLLQAGYKIQFKDLLKVVNEFLLSLDK